ncbi:MAG: hypothetical protein ACRDOL_21415 [Streptosporangiaceae bacterium]
MPVLVVLVKKVSRLAGRLRPGFSPATGRPYWAAIRVIHRVADQESSAGLVRDWASSAAVQRLLPPELSATEEM